MGVGGGAKLFRRNIVSTFSKFAIIIIIFQDGCVQENLTKIVDAFAAYSRPGRHGISKKIAYTFWPQKWLKK